MNTEREKLIELAETLYDHTTRMLDRVHHLADEATELLSSLDDPEIRLDDIVYPDDDLDDIEGGMLDAKETLTKLLS